MRNVTRNAAPGSHRRSRGRLANEDGFFLVGALGGLLGQAKKLAGKAATAVAKKVGIVKKPSQPQTPSQWLPGQPAPPGYQVVSAGTKSEHLETVRANDGTASLAGAEQRARETESFLDAAKRVLAEKVNQATADLTRQTGEAVARAAAQSETAQAAGKKVATYAVVGAVAVVLVITLVIVATRPRA